MNGIMHVIETGGPGGAESVFLKLAIGLGGDSDACIPIVSRDGWLAESLRERGLQPVVLPIKDLSALRYLWRLIRLIRFHRPRVVICHLFGASVYGSIAGLITNTPIVGVLHGQSDIPVDTRRMWLKRFVVRYGLKRLVVVSAAMKYFACENLRMPVQLVEVIPNGIDIDKVDSAPETDLRGELRVSDKSLLIGAVGNLRVAKDYPVMIDAIGALVQAGDDVHLAIVGECTGPLLSKLRRLVSSRGLESNVHFLGLRSDVFGLLKAVDVFVSSSRTEGFSLACIEAMACRVPVISTRSGGPEEILDDGELGALVPVGDSLALASAIAALSSDSERVKQQVTRAREKVERAYSERAMMSCYRSLINNALSNLRSPKCPQ